MLRPSYSGIEFLDPELIWRLAAIWANYKQEEFFSLAGDEQGSIVAAYLTNQQIDSLLSEAASKPSTIN